MFGYIRVNAAELRVREYECYRGLYCGLCKHMGKCTGQCSRLSLSYDFVFLAAVRMALKGERVTLQKKRCIVHPLHRRSCAVKSDTLAYCAHASALLTYHKLQDDREDERGGKRLRAILSKPLFHRAYRRAKKKYPILDQTIKKELSALSQIEKSPNAVPSADEPASCFGRLMAAVCSEGLENQNARIAASLGQAIGHWIYLADALDDYTEDCRRDRYNPFRALYPDGMTDSDRRGLQTALTLILERAEQAYLLIPPHPQSEINEILANIFYLGMPTAANEIAQGKPKKERYQSK